MSRRFILSSFKRFNFQSFASNWSHVPIIGFAYQGRWNRNGHNWNWNYNSYYHYSKHIPFTLAMPLLTKSNEKRDYNHFYSLASKAYKGKR